MSCPPPKCLQQLQSYVLPPFLIGPGRSGCNFENVIFKLALLICIFKSSYDTVAMWIPQEFTDNKSTSVQVMAWCRQAAIHYLSQCWHRSMSPYGVTRPQWVQARSLQYSRDWYGVDPIILRPNHSIRWYNRRFTHFDPLIFFNVLHYSPIQYIIIVYPICIVTHCGLVTPYGDINLGQHWLR